ncbi:hypothetical protein P3T23_009117 [Paraburkholderia sp. GAS448]|uniref:hypothetical protein n=1 Tax=Paraburkholderia sp. GAS448 TaxID=3035136 RepID=UPI003D1BB573
MKINQGTPEEPAFDIDGRQLFINSRCTIVAVHHPAFSADIGKKVVIAKLSGQTAWVYADKPVRYRVNRAGRDVVAHDPKSIQTLTSTAYLRFTVDDPTAGSASDRRSTP